ncbi:MAG: triose-phosphate isomerase, partial [bacterium]
MDESGRGGGRVPLIAGNWKMHKTSSEGAAFVRHLAERLGAVGDRDVVVAPPFTGLYEAVRAAIGTCVSVASQDVFWEVEGA